MDRLSPWWKSARLFSQFDQITVDDVKKSLVSHLWYAENNFKLLKRHFQLSIYVPQHARLATSEFRIDTFGMCEHAPN